MNEVNFHLVDGSKLTITLKTLDDVDSLTDLLRYTKDLETLNIQDNRDCHYSINWKNVLFVEVC
jgi:hypothetical protein